MMQFFRKHQKKLFLVIAIVTIASFLFFGTFSTLGAPEIPNKKIGKTVGGATIYERDLKALVHFLSLGSGGMLYEDLFEAGAFTLLADTYSDRVEREWREGLRRAQRAKAHSHPLYPALKAQLSETQSFAPYTALYFINQQLPLFGEASFEEWFGPTFTTLLGKFIFNAAESAEKRGYRVSQQEARSDLLLQCRQALKEKASGREVSPQEVAAFFRFHLQAAGVDESTLTRLWRKMMLIHRLFQDLEHGVLLDTLPYEMFSSFADAKASAIVYQLPETLRLSDFQSLLKVQYYLEAVAPLSRERLDLPHTFYTPEQIEKKHPQLVIHRYALEVVKASYEELALQVGLKELWDFETSAEGWSLLSAEFPLLKTKGGDRLQVLEQVEARVRKKIDRVALAAFLQKHPERVNELLARGEAICQHVPIRAKGEISPFDDIQETRPLLEILEQAEVGSVVQFTSPSLTYYQIKVVEKPHAKEIMTLDEALKNGILQKLVDNKLETALLDARKKDPAPYKDVDGTWKPFREVKDLVGAYVYADLLKTIAKEPLPLDEYAFRRFEALMREAKESIEILRDASPFLAKTDHPLLDQWKIAVNKKEIRRSDPSTLSKEALFTSPIGSWSSVATAHGDVSFFQLLGREEVDPAIHEEVYAGQRLIGKDMTQQITRTLLEEMGPL